MPAATQPEQPPLSTNLPPARRLFHSLSIVGASWLAVVTLVAGLVVGSPPPAMAATTHAVDIADFAFSPAVLTIAVGDTVTWTNRDAVVHTATGDGFDSGDLAQGASYSVTFTAPGTYDYLCTPHPTMTGRVVVEAAPASTAPPGSVPDVAMEPMPPAASRESAAIGALVLFVLVAFARAGWVVRRR
jgi:amicyanin